MVMGAVGGVGGAGIPGPPGPQGVQGPPGPLGGIDANSPLSVQTKAMALMGLPIPTNQWAVVNFAPPEIDTHQAVVLGPLWRWVAPMRGVYHLQTTMRLDAALGSPTWELRVLRSNQLVAETSITGLSGQISWLGVMQPLVTLQVLIRSSTPLILASDPLNFPGSISIAGVGVAL